MRGEVPGGNGSTGHQSVHETTTKFVLITRFHTVGASEQLGHVLHTLTGNVHWITL